MLFLLSKGSVTLQKVRESIESSPCVAILIDESMDVTTVEQLVVYVKYISFGEAVDAKPVTKTSFLGIVEVSRSRRAGTDPSISIGTSI